MTLFDYEMVFFPINVSNSHWTLAVVYPQRCTIQYYDSMGGPGTGYLRSLLCFLRDEHQANAVSRECAGGRQGANRHVAPTPIPQEEVPAAGLRGVAAAADAAGHAAAEQRQRLRGVRVPGGLFPRGGAAVGVWATRHWARAGDDRAGFAEGVHQLKIVALSSPRSPIECALFA